MALQTTLFEARRFDLSMFAVSASQVVQHSVSCLGAVVNKVTHNYKFVWACFNRYYGKCYVLFIPSL